MSSADSWRRQAITKIDKLTAAEAKNIACKRLRQPNCTGTEAKKWLREQVYRIWEQKKRAEITQRLTEISPRVEHKIYDLGEARYAPIIFHEPIAPVVIVRNGVIIVKDVPFLESTQYIAKWLKRALKNTAIPPGSIYAYKYSGDGHGFASPRGKPLYTPRSAAQNIHDVVIRLYTATQIDLHIYSPNTELQPVKLRDGPINCVLDQIIMQSATTKGGAAVRRQVLEYARDNGFIEGDKPADCDDLKKFAKKFRVRIRVYSQVALWYDTNPTDDQKRRTINIFAENGHATQYIPIRKIKNQVIHDIYSLTQASQAITAPKKLSGIEKQDTWELTAFRVGDTIHKIYQPPAPDATNPDYFSCTSELSYRYKKFYNDNHLRPLNEPFYDIFKHCDHHLTTQQFMSYAIGQKAHLTDQNKAFPTFEQSEYYPEYKIFYGHVQMYTTDSLEYIMRPGASHVVDVEYNPDYPIIELTQWIQPGCWYTNIRLRFILDNNLARFKINTAIIAVKSEALEFPWKPFDNNPEHKRFNNSFIGKLITGGQTSTCWDRYCVDGKSETDRLQLEYDLARDPRSVSIVNDGGFIMHEVRSQKSQLYHVHAQILDYQQVALMKKLIRVPISELIAIFTDGFFTTEKQPFEYSSLPHEFKYEYAPIKAMSKYEPDIHLVYAADVSPPIEHHLSRLHALTATTGPAGCGKTHISMVEHRRVCANSLAPSHKLKDQLSATCLTADTYHNYFGIGSAYDRNWRPRHEQLDIDECTQIPDNHLRIIIDMCTRWRVCLSLFGDFKIGEELKIYQRPPCRLAGPPIELNTLRDFVITEEISEIRRQSPEDAAFLDSLRDLSEPQQRKICKERFRVITEAEAIAEMIQHPQAIGIASAHKICNRMSRPIYEGKFAALPDEYKYLGITVPARAIKNAKPRGEAQIIKGQTMTVHASKVFMDRNTSDRTAQPTPKEYIFELAYFNTADSIQGDSVPRDIPMYIHLEDCGLENFLYVAVTRCRELAQITLVV